MLIDFYLASIWISGKNKELFIFSSLLPSLLPSFLSSSFDYSLGKLEILLRLFCFRLIILISFLILWKVQFGKVHILAIKNHIYKSQNIENYIFMRFQQSAWWHYFVDGSSLFSFSNNKIHSFLKTRKYSLE